MGVFDSLPKDVRAALADSHSGVSPLVAARLLRRLPVERVVTAIAIVDRHLCGIGGVE